MKFGYMFANVGPFVSPAELARLAHTAEQAGFESIWAIEHVVIPRDYTTPYPYHPSGRLPGDESWPVPDPLLPLAYVAATTTRLKLATGILILPQRHPLYVAKQAATLDVLSRGRAILGVGIGWLREEFDALGIPFQERAARAEEAIQALRSLWRPGAEAFDGDFFRWDAVASEPRPVQAGGVPIVIGGHAEAAARRAARLGNGFFPGRGDAEDMRRLVAVLRDECARIERDPAEVEVTMPLLKPDLDQVRRYADLGAARIVTGVPKADADAVLRSIGELGEQVIAKL